MVYIIIFYLLTAKCPTSRRTDVWMQRTEHVLFVADIHLSEESSGHSCKSIKNKYTISF